MATTILGLPELESAQGQKYLTVNQAMQRLDALVNLTVFNRTQTAPPVSPAAGYRYIVAATATGAFAGQETKVALYLGSNWIFFSPSEGWRAYDQGANQHVTFNGTAWVVDGVSSGSLSDGSVTLLGVNATPDTTNRLSVSSPGILFNRETDDINVTLNKAAAGDDAGFLLQTGFSTRARFGLLANDDFTLTVSADGAAFNTALSIDKDTGNVAIAGATADGTNALIIGGANVLHSNGSGSVSHKFSKNVAGSDAGLDFQTNFISQALIGLLGNNDFTVKVGSGATTAIVIANSSGSVSLAEHSKFSSYVNFDKYIGAGAWTDIAFNTARHNDQGDWSAGTFTAPHDGYYMFGVGYRWKVNSLIPADIRVGLSVNAANPTADAQATTGDATITSLQSFVQVTALLKLSSGDTVQGMAFMTTNDGYVEADNNFFWGAQIA
jgi:hypothetical protein